MSVEYVSIPPRIARVLDAARAWAVRNPIECCELMRAIDALDAPVERYYVEPYELSWRVMDGDVRSCGIHVALCDHQYKADRIAAALNAADRKRTP